VRSKDGKDGARARLRIVGEPQAAPSEASLAAAAEAAAEAQRERDRIVLELELAEERRQMRRALAAKLVEEFKTRPGAIPVRALRTAVIDRDLTEEECERLRLTLAKLESAAAERDKPNKR
jgi:hypothetical protein